MSGIYAVEVTTITGKKTTLEPYKGRVLLIVNVASRCGFTPQYAELESLYQEYKDRGLVILGFPCNQFLKQEPGNEDEIKAFAESCYRVTFPLFAKVDVRGANQAPLYRYLQNHIQQKSLLFIPWNFTKVLVDTEGNVLKRYPPTASFKSIRTQIEQLLSVKL